MEYSCDDSNQANSSFEEKPLLIGNYIFICFVKLEFVLWFYSIEAIRTSLKFVENSG